MGDFDADAFLSFGGGGSEVWGEDDVRCVAQWGFGGGRLGFKNIKGGTGEVSGGEVVGEGLFIHEAASGAIDDAGTFFHASESFRVKHVTRFGGEGHVHGKEVSAWDGIVEVFN